LKCCMEDRILRTALQEELYSTEFFGIQKLSISCHFLHFAKTEDIWFKSALEGRDCLYISPKHWDLTGESMVASPKIVFSSQISLQSAFINPIGGLFKRLFPLGHMNY
jgi:hypothetical protein